LDVAGCRDLDLGEESIATEHGAELRPQHFERDQAVVAHVPREIDGRHAASADLPLDDVAAGEHLRKLGGDVHGAARGRTVDA
jgi:hypothetical protein